MASIPTPTSSSVRARAMTPVRAVDDFSDVPSPSLPSTSTWEVFPIDHNSPKQLAVMGDFNVQRQCQTCLATFQTNDALRAHLKAYWVSTIQDVALRPNPLRVQRRCIAIFLPENCAARVYCTSGQEGEGRDPGQVGIVYYINRKISALYHVLFACPLR
jgi:hypothetical protein